MELLSKEQMRKYIKEGNLKDLNDVQAMVKELFASAVQEMLEAEMDTHLGYTKHDTKNKQTENSRNGHSKKTVDSELGEMTMEVPRDRQGEFDPVLVKKHQKRMPSIEE